MGFEGLPAAVRRPLLIAYAASVANVMGVNLLYPVLPAMAGEMSVSESEVALSIVVFTAPAIVLSPLFGLLADLYGRRWPLALGLIGFGVCGTAVGVAPDFGWVLILRTLQGVAMSAFNPLTVVLVGDLLEGTREISGQGLKVVIDRVAMMVIPVAGGLLALASWRLSFFTYALVVPVGFLAVWRMPETLAGGQGSTKVYLGGVLDAIRRPRLFAAFLAGFLRFFLDYGFFTYFPLILALSYGVSTAESGLLFLFFGAGAILSASQVGRLARSFDLGRLLLVAFTVCGVSVLVWPLLDSFLLWGATLVFYGLANGLISPLQKSLLTQNAPTELRGGVISVDRTVQQVGKSAAPALLGLLLASGYQTVFWAMGILSLASVALATVFLKASSYSKEPSSRRNEDEAGS